MKITGKVVTGLGEGKFFLSMEHYRNEIKKKLGYEVYPGTLNIETKSNPDGIKKLAPLRIEGYTKEGKTFGGATCYKAKTNGTECAIIVPDITRHNKNIIELIAPVHLRTKLSLKDNDEITAEAK